MNILIVGNGFDLSHYLPTKYDHFMDVMQAIESKETGEKKVVDLSIHTVNEWMRMLDQIFEKRKEVEKSNYDMDFDELFSCIRDKWFIEKTKELYLTEQIKISFQDVLKFKYRLELNDWYQYFKNHIKEVKTWIDFEIKISEALRVVANFLVQLENTMDEFGSFSTEICFYGERAQKQVFLKREYCNVLELFKILKSGYFIDQEDYDESGYSFNFPIEIDDPNQGDLRFYISNTYILLQSGFSKIKIDKILSELYKQLDEFIEIFNQYLELIVNQLNPLETLQIGYNDWIYPDKIYSFNYTKTYQRFYDAIEVDYLHGSHGERQNIVLGVSNLEHENLKRLKAYGFTKYHQKLFKNTQYLFLSENLDRIKKNVIRKKELETYIENSVSNNSYNVDLKRNELAQTILTIGEKIRIYIWGHSLDSSDSNYIKEIFSFNGEIVEHDCDVTVFFFNNQAKFDLLNNLLHILGSELVEKWMKKGWLTFEPNPNITETNII